MRKLLIVALLAYHTLTYGQNMDYRSVISVGNGYSGLGFVIENADITDNNLSTKSRAALQLGYDFGIKKWLSVGLGVSYQKFYIEYTNSDDYIQDHKIPDFSSELSRLNYSSRVFFHYANSNKLDLYSGLRLGYTDLRINLDIPDFFFLSDKWLEYTTGRISTQLVLFGIRYYISDHIGFSSEIAFGSPHVFSLGINGRF